MTLLVHPLSEICGLHIQGTLHQSSRATQGSLACNRIFSGTNCQFCPIIGTVSMHHTLIDNVGAINNNKIFNKELTCGHVVNNTSRSSSSNHEFAVKLTFSKSPTLQSHARVNDNFTRKDSDTLSGSPEHSYLCPTNC